jgi:transposase
MQNANTRTQIVLSEAERAELNSMARSRSLPAALALRARIVLACAGVNQASTEIAQALGINRNTVMKWRARYARLRIAGLYDELRPGRPRTVDDEQVAALINKTLHTKPAGAATHWSTRNRQHDVLQLSFFCCRSHKCSAAIVWPISIRSPKFFQALKSAEHLGGNGGGNSLSFRSLFTLEFDSRRLHHRTSMDLRGSQ